MRQDGAAEFISASFIYFTLEKASCIIHNKENKDIAKEYTI